MTDPSRRGHRTLVHPSVLASLWDHGPRSATVWAAYERWKAPNGPRIMLLDSIRRDVLERIGRSVTDWPLDGQIAAILAQDVTDALRQLAIQENVETIPTGPLLTSALALSTNLQVSMEDAMYLFVASATGDELLFLDLPTEAR